MSLQYSRFASLRWKLLLPILASAIVIATLVAVFSFLVGRHRALSELDQRRAAVERTILSASFPLTAPVAKAIATLADVELVVLNADYELDSSTLPVDPTSTRLFGAVKNADGTTSASGIQAAGETVIDGEEYLVWLLDRKSLPSDQNSGQHVVLLFEKSAVTDASLRAATWPLITGLTITALLSTVVLLSTSRLARRIRDLQQCVRKVALGNFDEGVKDLSPDELGRLGQDVNAMGGQLQSLWATVQREESTRLLHQLSAGMAHQLRNTLTGARLALELYVSELTGGQKTGAATSMQPEELVVVDRELTRAEEFVRRLLMVGAGEQRIEDRPACIADCLSDLKSSHDIVADHLSVEMTWSLPANSAFYQVADGGTLVAAISNLILNAIDAGTNVRVQGSLQDATLTIDVSDDGPGILDEVKENLFQPLVTSKPEGLGLGLALVQRAAEKLHGGVSWNRREGITTFSINFPVQPLKSDSDGASNI